MEANELKSKILSANKAYRSGNPVMSDQQFDDLVESLQKQITEDEFNEILEVNSDIEAEINGIKMPAADILEAVYVLFVK